MAKVKAAPKCKECDTEIPYAVRNCVGCGRDVGCPNVRAADTKDEIEALQERVRYAQLAAKQRGCANELEAFGTASSDSSAVTTLKISSLDSMVSQSLGMVSYYKMVRAGIRNPEDNEFDANRGRIDGTVNPHGVHEEIQYAVLSLDGQGVSWYGDYSVTLKENMVEDRASVFEENPFRFCDKYPISPTGSVPHGFRASWARRAELAMAKLHPRIQAGMTDVDFPPILVEQGVKSADSDFIEVHIYGVLHARAIERVIAPKIVSRPDRAIWKRTKARLLELGAVVDEV
ncbi:hypothetical protein [Croceicoccus marinus]|nr:hypothetical protein [Croceicoccus marinus]